MNWEAIGAVGELVGALAVVASLVYLALQIRHSARLAQVQIDQAEAAALQAQMDRVMEYPEVGIKISHGVSDPEAMRLYAFWWSWLWNASFKFRNRRSRQQLRDMERLYGQYISYWFRSVDEFHFWWEAVETFFPLEFAKWVNSRRPKEAGAAV